MKGWDAINVVFYIAHYYDFKLPIHLHTWRIYLNPNMWSAKYKIVQLRRFWAAPTLRGTVSTVFDLKIIMTAADGS